MQPGFKEIYLHKPWDAPRTAVSLPIMEPPGAAFQYGPANMEIFGELLKRILKPHRLTPLQYLQERLLRPLGIEYGEWKTDRSGNPQMSAGVKMRAHDLLRLGRLVLARGNWEGKQLISSDLFTQALRGSYANPMYGMTFWYNDTMPRSASYEVNVEQALESPERFDAWEGACLAKAAPRDLLAMIGSGNQRVYVVPSHNLVVVRQGYGTQFSDGEFWKLLF